MTLGAARVIWDINDLSLFVDEIVRGYVTMIIQAERGPINQALIISSMDEYSRRFGKKVPYTTDPLVVEMALRQGARLNIIRAAHYADPSDPTTLTAVRAERTFNDRGDTPNCAMIESEAGPFILYQAAAGSTIGTEVGQFEFTTGTDDKFSASVQAGTGCTIDVDSLVSESSAIATVSIGAGGNNYIIGDILTLAGGAGGKVTVDTVSSGVVTAVSLTSAGTGYTVTTGVATTCVGETQTITLSGSMTAAQVCDYINAHTNGIDAVPLYDEGSHLYVVKIAAHVITASLKILSISDDCYTLLGISEGTYAAIAGTNDFLISVDGDADQAFVLDPPGGEDGEFTLTTGQVVMRLAAITDATVYAYENKVRILSNTFGPEATIQVKDCGAYTALGYDLSEHAGTDTGTALPTLKIKALNEGDWGDDLKIIFTPSALHPDLYFNMRVVYDRQGNMEEYFGDMSMDAESDRYIVNYVAAQSFLVDVIDLHSGNDTPLNMPATNGTGQYLEGGDNGLESFGIADWIGESQAQTGIYAVDSTYMSMDMMIPGTTSVDVYQAMITYCENRGDMMGYGVTPPGNDPEDTVNWRMGSGSYTHPAFNSHRFSLWFGRPLVFDDRDSAQRYVPNLGHLAACLCRTDNSYGSHYAPVGPRRGVVSLVDGIDFNIQDYRSTGYGDLFAEYGINYLMISKMPGIEGAMFWEQRTTQRAASATRELNVMRFITVVNRTMMPILRTFLFEPNHPVTWREVHRALEPAFADWKNKYAIYDYCIQTDRDAFFDGGELKNAVLNSGLDIDRGIYRCRALIQPTRAIYYLEFELGVMRTGESFEDYKSMKYLPGWIRQ